MADTEAPQADEDYIFLSALNQYSYCPLRCYWMFVEYEYAGLRSSRDEVKRCIEYMRQALA